MKNEDIYAVPVGGYAPEGFFPPSASGIMRVPYLHPAPHLYWGQEREDEQPINCLYRAFQFDGKGWMRTA